MKSLLFLSAFLAASAFGQVLPVGTYTIQYWKDHFYQGATNIQTGSFGQCMGFGGSGNTNTGTNWNDAISSAQIPSGINCRFYTDGGCRGASVLYYGPDNIDDFLFDHINDEISSFRCNQAPSVP